MQPCYYCRGGTPGGNRHILHSKDGYYLGWVCDQCAAMPEQDRPFHRHGVLSMIGCSLGVLWLMFRERFPLRRRDVAKTREMADRPLPDYSERSFAANSLVKAAGLLVLAGLFIVIYPWLLFMAFVWHPLEARIWPHAAERRYPT